MSQEHTDLGTGMTHADIKSSLIGMTHIQKSLITGHVNKVTIFTTLTDEGTNDNSNNWGIASNGSKCE